MNKKRRAEGDLTYITNQVYYIRERHKNDLEH